MCIHMYICVYICIYVYTYVYICIYIYMFIHTYIHIYLHVYLHIYIHVYLHIYLHMYIYIYNIHTHKRDAPQNQWYIMVFHCTFPISLAGVSPFRVGAHEVLVKPRQGALFQVVQW